MMMGLAATAARRICSRGIWPLNHVLFGSSVRRSTIGSVGATSVAFLGMGLVNTGRLIVFGLWSLVFGSMMCERSE